jgi:site-specific recombinase XerD
MSGFTEKTIKAARADDGELFLWDGDLPGFGCRVKPSGVKTFLVQYRVANRSRRVKLGRWPAMRVEKARTEALRLLAEIGDGGDPATRKRQERAARDVAQTSTLAAAAATFIRKNYVEPQAKSAYEMQRIWTKVILPELGSRPVSALTRGDVIALLDKTETAARDPKRGWNGARTANFTLARLRTFFRWAMDRELVGADPTAGIRKRKGEHIGDRVLSDAELRWVALAADALPTPAGPYLKLLLLLGQRREATATLRRSAVDAQDRVWKIPGAGYKSGAYHEVPFSAAAWGVIEPLLHEAEGAGRDHLLVSAIKRRGDVPVQNYSGIKADIDGKIAELAGSPLAPWGFHDLRRSMRTVMPRLRVSNDVAELCLGHTRAGIRAVYDHHTYRDEKRAAFAAWGEHIDRLVNPPAATNVVTLATTSTAA